MKAFIPSLIAAVIAVAIGTADARNRGVPAEPGDFDYFLLSMSVAPSFCALSPTNAAKDECRVLTAADYRQTPLTLHGLWPNRAGVSVNRQPQDCAGPPLDTLSAPVQAALRRYMPAGPGLARYEWRKHGACAGMTPEAYFAAMTRLAGQADETIGTILRAPGVFGSQVRIDDLLAAVARRDPALAPAIVVYCRFPRGGGPALIAEIRVTLSKDLAPVPARDVGLGQNSGCPQGAGFLPAGPA